MKYKIDPIPGMPTWFTPGIVCLVRDCSDDDWQQPRPIDCFNGPRSGMCHPFKDRNGRNWPYAEPVETWEPQEGEWVAAWINESSFIRIVKYGKLMVIAATGQEIYKTSGGDMLHVARLQYPDGRVIDCACSVEELKGRTDWI